MSRVHNLTFHGIGRPERALGDGESDVWVEAGTFRSIVEAVAERPEVQLTFDDGNLSDVTTALPELVRAGLRARFFVVVDRIGRPGFLSRQDLRALLDAGMSIGSHGMAHRRWPGLPAAELEAETTGAKERLEDLTGSEITAAGCPFGAYDRRSLAALVRAGFTRVYTSDRGPADTRSWLQARTTVSAREDAAAVLGLLDARPSRVAQLVRSAKGVVKRWR
jgi:peptidoglycan/xylan/chitin deacetylase (PgdA/CDA1 family)